MPAPWSIVPARVQAIELGRLRAVALAMVASIPVAMAFQRIVDPSLVVTLTSGAAWLGAVAAYLGVRKGRVPPARAGLVICALWVLAAGSLLSGYAVYRDVGWSSLLVIVMIANGSVHIDPRWVLAPTLVVGAAWLVTAVRLGHAGFTGLFLVVALALTWLAHAANRAFVRDVEHLRDLAEARSRELAGALEDARRAMVQRERAEQDRERLREQFVEAQKLEAIGTLAGGLAHDMNNVLASILSLAELVRDAPADAGARADLDAIIAACKRGGEMTRNMVAFSRRGTYRKERTDLEPVVRQVVEMLTRSASKRIRLQLELAGALDVDGDAAQLAQALVNLCLNSVDAIAGDGEITVSARALRLDRDPPGGLSIGDYVVLTVADTGAGMTEATRARMFEPFFTTKPQGAGTGLGLAMVYGAVQSHGGAIVVDTAPGRGTSIAIYIPAASLPARPSAPPSAAPLARRGRVLVVDDEPVIRTTSKRVLERHGYDVIAADSGAQAIAQFRDHHDAVVVLDMSMPGMGGAECFRELRAIDPGARVLLVSGYAIQDDIRACLEAGAAGFVAKPFATAVLLDAVAVVARGEQLPPIEA